jgi:hypothetical protein
MKSKFSVLSLLLLILFVTSTSFAAELVERAVSENVAESAAAIEELRSLGPAGLNELRTRYAAQIQKHIDDPTLKTDAEWTRITKALDSVSGQKNSYLSGLYWYTDLKEAEKVATQSGKPILSLRLLGKLTDELSCANSRFFRTVLYSNTEIAAVLRDRFVLHWQSVRPAPVITIDFGDGRKLERTITGNSIHYVLDSSGQLLEAFPGLYGPQAFLRRLADAEGLFNSLGAKAEQQRTGLLSQYYRTHQDKINVAWYEDITRIGGQAPKGFMPSTGPDGKLAAITIMPLAITKAYSEANMLRAMTATPEGLGKITDEAAWKKIAQFHAPDAVLDNASIGLIKRQNAGVSEQELAAMIQKFQELIALDTVRNEYLLHTKLYPWLLRDPSRTDLEKFNEKVYAELFLTPRSDPWLGLLIKDAYLGIDNAGVK